MKKKLTSELNVRQKAFCEQYLIDLNGKQAAIRAGYSKRTAKEQAYELLTRPHVRAYVDFLRQKASERNKISVDEVIRELAGILRSNPSEFYDPIDGSLIPTHQLTGEQAKSLESIDISAKAIKVKFHSKIQAANLLLKHLGGFEKDNEQLKSSIIISFED